MFMQKFGIPPCFMYLCESNGDRIGVATDSTRRLSLCLAFPVFTKHNLHKRKQNGKAKMETDSRLQELRNRVKRKSKAT